MKKLLLILSILLSGFVVEAAKPRDPFIPLATKWRVVRGVPILQQYDLSQLRLAGIIRSNGDERILFRDPTGRSHIVTTKDKVGKGKGTISKVKKRSVVIREDVKKQDGTVQSHYITMTIRR